MFSLTDIAKIVDDTIAKASELGWDVGTYTSFIMTSAIPAVVKDAILEEIAEQLDHVKLEGDKIP